MTEPDSLAHLLDLEGDVHLRVDEAGDGSFPVRRAEKETGGRKAECWSPREAACERSEQMLCWFTVLATGDRLGR